jgi:hypothetical protein
MPRGALRGAQAELALGFARTRATLDTQRLHGKRHQSLQQQPRRTAAARSGGATCGATAEAQRQRLDSDV